MNRAYNLGKNLLKNHITANICMHTITRNITEVERMISVSRRAFLSISKRIFLNLFYLGIAPFYLVRKNFDRCSMLDNKEIKGILVLYASFHGSTAQIAEFMKRKLKIKGINASVKSIDDEIDFFSYSGIIMGSPIHRGKWMDEAVAFVNMHREEFDNLLIACFYTCMSKAKQPPTDEIKSELALYTTAMTTLFPTLPPSRIGSFAGMLDYDNCSFAIKLVMWLIMKKHNLEAGDYRDWQAIEAWLNKIEKVAFSKSNTRIIESII